MKILVISGGRGSVALQRGLYFITGKNCDNLINLYDDGDSTGKTKRVCNTLAPPDVRKNHALKYELNGKVNPTIAYIYEKRFDLKGSLSDYLYSELNKIEDKDFKKICIEGVEKYLSCDYSEVEYNDFALPNIIYVGLFKKYGVKAAERIISLALNLDSRIYVNSEEVLRICGLTESGILIPNEYEMSNYNSEDRIKEIFFLDKYDRKKIPSLDEDSEKAILEADIIIFSAGTQWSSLIPTYVTKGFAKAVERSKAKKYLVINVAEDGDTKGYSAQDFYELAAKYLPLRDIKIVSYMPINAKHEVIINKDIVEGKKHNPLLLAQTIMNDLKKDITDEINDSKF